MDPIIAIVLSLMVLLGIACLLLPLAARLALPYSMLLALLGILVGVLAASSQAMEWPTPLFDVLDAIRNFGLTGNVFLYAFLPSLLFAAGLSVDVRRLMDDVAPVLILAVIAVILCALVVGASLHYVFAVPLAVALLLGSVIATTDPAAVIAIFRDIGVPRRLQILVEGESLFNDAAAIALFTMLLGVVAGMRSEDFAAGAVDMVVDFVGGLLLGYAAARAVCTLLHAVNEYPIAEITLTICLAYITYIAGDVYFHVSGVVATVTAALVMGSIGRTHLSSAGWSRLQAIWHQIEFLGSTLIFVLAATMIPSLLADLQWYDTGMLALVVLATLVARAVALYGVIPALSALRLSPSVSPSHKAVILWGGLRGAVTLAMALSVVENPQIPDQHAHLVAVLATGFVLFTLFVNAPTLRPLIGVLGLNRLSPLEAALHNRAIAVSSAAVRKHLGAIASELGIDGEVLERTHLALNQPDMEDPQTLADSLPLDDLCKVGLATLAAREEELYLEGLGHGTISKRIIGRCIAQTGRLRDAAMTGGAAAYTRVADRELHENIAFRAALWLHNRFGIATPLALLLGDRFEEMLITRATLHRLLAFTRTSVTPLLGAAIEDGLTAALNARIEGIDTAIRAFELQYPGYAQLLRASYVGLVALRLEQVEYRQKRDEALISQEVYRALNDDMRRRREVISGRPTLDLGIEVTDMIKQVPLFAEMNPEQLRAIAALLRPRLAVPGEVIIRKGERGKAMFFIAAGTVDVHDPATDMRVSRHAGGYFGEIALLHQTRRTADVTARGYCHFLVLYVRDFRRLLRQHPSIRAEIADTAKSRMSASDASGDPEQA